MDQQVGHRGGAHRVQRGGHDRQPRTWRGGCTIRARLLERIRRAYAAQSLPTLLAAPSVVAGLDASSGAWRRVVSHAVAAGTPVPWPSSALASYDTVRAERLPAALVQGLRDPFGAHTYRRVDREGVFHTEWSLDRSETQLR
jgi:6-phosphogluconate dehydrogenase